MSGLYKRKRDVALITIVNKANDRIDLVEDKPNEKRVKKKGRDGKWIKDQDNLFLYYSEGFCRFIHMNYV